MAGSLRAPSVPRAVVVLEPLARLGVLGAPEVHAAGVLARVGGVADPRVVLGSAFALRAPLRGDVCVDLATVRASVAAEVIARREEFGDLLGDTLMAEIAWPEVDEWLTALTSSGLVRTADRHERTPLLDDHPLVLHGSRLYTQRQWIDECTVASHLLARASSALPPTLTDSALELLGELLPPREHGVDNAQHAAARAALGARLSVIVGGPGTGKTHTVARLLAVLQADADERAQPLRVGLAAPTGKAAARVQQALTDAAADLPSAVADRLRSLTAVTLHRLLGSRPGVRTRFAHDAVKPLPYDIIVVDETSMVALPMMARLLEAVPPHARLVLVGDPDQLESIDAGAVLADIVDAANEAQSPLAGHVVRLTRVRRQEATSAVARLADAIRENRPDDVIELLTARHADLSFIETDDPLRAAAPAVRELVVPPLGAVVEAAGDGRAEDALHAFARVRVLCGHRRGPFGAEAWNDLIESWVLGGPPRTRFYAGRPLLATRNDRRLRVANGDTGVVVAGGATTQAAFAASDGIRLLSPLRLEAVETSFATTIHKSQGSEYPLVIVILPPASSPIVGRELLYTAVTRTSDRLLLVGTREAVVNAVCTPSRRQTGLRGALAAASVS